MSGEEGAINTIKEKIEHMGRLSEFNDLVNQAVYHAITELELEKKLTSWGLDHHEVRLVLNWVGDQAMPLMPSER